MRNFSRRMHRALARDANEHTSRDKDISLSHASSYVDFFSLLLLRGTPHSFISSVSPRFPSFSRQKDAIVFQKKSWPTLYLNLGTVFFVPAAPIHPSIPSEASLILASPSSMAAAKHSSPFSPLPEKPFRSAWSRSPLPRSPLLHHPQPTLLLSPFPHHVFFVGVVAAASSSA